MKRLARIPFVMFLGLALATPVAASAQAASVELLDVRIGDRCVQTVDLGYDRIVLDVRGRVKDVSAGVEGNVLMVTSNIPVAAYDFTAVNAVLKGDAEWVFDNLRAAGSATLAVNLTERISSAEPVFSVSVLKGAYPEGGSNQSRLVIDVYEDTADSCS